MTESGTETKCEAAAAYPAYVQLLVLYEMPCNIMPPEAVYREVQIFVYIRTDWIDPTNSLV